MHSGVPKMMARHLNSSRDRSKKECQVDEDYCGGGQKSLLFRRSKQFSLFAVLLRHCIRGHGNRVKVCGKTDACHYFSVIINNGGIHSNVRICSLTVPMSRQSELPRRLNEVFRSSNMNCADELIRLKDAAIYFANQRYGNPVNDTISEIDGTLIIPINGIRNTRECKISCSQHNEGQHHTL